MIDAGNGPAGHAETRESGIAPPGRRGVVITLILGYGILSLLLFFVFYGGVRRGALLDRLLFEQELGRVLSLTRIAPLLEGEISLDEINDISPIHINGVAIYDEGGRPFFGLGEYPELLVPPEDGEARLERNQGNDGFIYIRSFNEFGRPPRELPFQNDYQPRLPDRLPSRLYLDASAEGVLAGSGAIWWIYGLVEALLAMLFLLLGRMYLRNQEFRRQLADQQQLVHLGEAARTLTHEIKNPLSAIGLRLSILKKTAGSEAAEDLMIIQEEINRLNTLSGRIREFLKNPGGTPQRVDIILFLRDLVRRMPQPTVLQCNDEADPEAEVWIDPDRLRSILENLVVNGHEAGGDSGVELVIERQKQRIEILVLDRGEGVDDDRAERIFDPFYTTRSKGSGIGLAIARQFARAAGGEIQYHPREGGGSRFLLVLPLLGYSGKGARISRKGEDADVDSHS